MIEKLIIGIGVTLVVFGFVHFVVLDHLWPHPGPQRTKMKKIAGIITISLTIMLLIVFLIPLVRFLIEQI